MGSADAELAAETVRRIQTGDRAAEAALVERHQRGVLYLLRHRTGDPDLAEDLLQDTFRVVLERLRGKGLAEPHKLAGFLRATAQNLWLNEYRKRARRKTDEDSEVVERTVEAARGQLDETIRGRQALAIRQLLGELKTERDRQILMRFYLAEEDKAEICADLELSSLHFNRVLHRAKLRFKEILERERERWDVAARMLSLLLGAAW